MKRRIFSKWSVGLGLLIFLSAAPVLRSTGGPATPPSGVSPALMTDAEPAATLGDAPGELAAADTDAPAKLVSADKPVPPNIRPTGPVGEVIKLANSGLDQSVMLAFVTNSTSTFNLGAEEIIYLNDLGVPGAVVTAMILRDQEIKSTLAAAVGTMPGYQEQPAPAVASTDNSPVPDQMAPPPYDSSVPPAVDAPLTPPEISDEMFYDSLSPYGNWVDIEGYGRCWQPTAVACNPGWQPYFDGGRWVYSDCGWYWRSDYSWGWAPFHYGSWFRHGHLGWCWFPGTVWGPSWVSWRYNGQNCGWAPLPPDAVFTAGGGLSMHGQPVGEREDLGLRPGHYHFVPWNHFQDRQLRPSSLPPLQVVQAYENSVAATRITGDSHTVINNGLPVSRVAAATHRPIHTVALRDSSASPTASDRTERLESSGQTLAVYRPTPENISHYPHTGRAAGLIGGAGTSSVQVPPPAAGPWAPRSTVNTTASRPPAGTTPPLILNGAQSSAARETPRANSLVVVGARNPNPAQTSAYPWQPAQSAARAPLASTAESAPRASSSPSAAGAPGQNTPDRPPTYPDRQRNWVGAVSASPQPSWFSGGQAGDPHRLNGTFAAPRTETRTYQPAPRINSPDVPRYAPTPSYTPSYSPQHSYSAPAASAPARSQSFESRPAPSAPSAPSSGSSNSRSR